MTRPRNLRYRQVVDLLRERIETTGSGPRYSDVGAAIGISAVAAWKHAQRAVAEGLFVKLPNGQLRLPGAIDLAGVPSGRLRGELARRGVTFDALEEPKLLPNEGRPCAAIFCEERVERGKLFCRHHWFQLPQRMRSAILNAWSARQMQAYGDALEAARDYLGGFTRVVDRVG